MHKQPLEQKIIACVRKEYGISVATLRRSALGADVDAAVYQAHAHDELSYFIKLKCGHDTFAADIQILLYAVGIKQVIAPVVTRTGAPTQQLDGYTLSVYPFIKGRDGFAQDFSDEQWVALGAAVRDIHAVQVPSLIKEKITQEDYSPRWRHAVRSVYAHIDAGLRAHDDVGAKMLAMMRDQRETIERLIDHAEKRAKDIQRKSPPVVLCHADLHAGNVMLADDGALYIVDWDQPIMAPKERDLMFIGGGVGNVWNKSHEATLFYQGYGSTQIDQDILAYYRCERVIEDIAEYAQLLLLQADGGDDRKNMLRHFLALFEQNGVVDIALTSCVARNAQR